MTGNRKLFGFIAGSAIAITSLSIALYLYIQQLPYTSTGMNVVIRLDQGPCRGPCPIYKVTIYGSGLAIYEGQRFVDVEGKRIIFISDETINELLAEVENAHFFALEDTYAFPAFDVPFTIITITINGQIKRIWHEGQCGLLEDIAPEELCKVEQKINVAVNAERWVGDGEE